MMLRRASTVAVESMPAFFRVRLRVQPFLLNSTSPFPTFHVGLGGINGSTSISLLSTAAERSSIPDMHSENNEAVGDFQRGHDGPDIHYPSYGSFRGGTVAWGFNQNSQRAIGVQDAKGLMDRGWGSSTAFPQIPDSSIHGGSSLPSQYGTNGRLHQIPEGGDGLAGTNRQPQNIYPEDSNVSFQHNPAEYSGSASADKDGCFRATDTGENPCHLQGHYQQGSGVYRSEMPTGYQHNSAGFSGTYSQPANLNLPGSSTEVNKQAHHDYLVPQEYHQRTNEVHVGNPGFSSGLGSTGFDIHEGNFQQLRQASGSSLGNEGSACRRYAGNEVGQFLLNGSRTDEENMTYSGTIDELDRLCKEGEVKDAVKVLGMLQQQGIVVDLARYFLLFQICGENKSVEEARIAHEHVLRSLGNVEVKVYNKMLDMYCKCGSVEDARRLFETMPERNLASWDYIIMGLATNGLGEESLLFFTEFKQKGLRPDGDIFLTVFHVCGILGAVDEGFLHFESMSKEFGIQPTMEHYRGIVSMLGAAGYLDEAMEFIDTFPTEPTIDVWETLMNYCRVHGDVELGDLCAQIIEELNSSKLTEDSRRGLLPVKASDQVSKDKKKAELGARGRVHEYRAGDRSHPESDRIYALLKCLAFHMKESGYIPETKFVLHDVDQESKEEALLHHSEKLALSYGLMTTPARTPIRIIKNLRSCVDCHNFMKIVSKLVGRQLIIRDAKRFHHFENGLCSCRDYW